MEEHEEIERVFLNPGYICLPAEPTSLCAVTGSSLIVTLYDRVKKIGGMSHYIFSDHPGPRHATPLYCLPSIIGLVRLFRERGCQVEDLEAHIYGGAQNPSVAGFVEGLGEKNSRRALEVLEKIPIPVTGSHIGGNRGRKVIFHTVTGEHIVANVERIRDSDWYPSLNL